MPPCMCMLNNHFPFIIGMDFCISYFFSLKSHLYLFIMLPELQYKQNVFFAQGAFGIYYMPGYNVN